MNNSNNTQAVIRTLVIYALCIPLAVWIGYLLAAPADRSTFGIGGILALIMAAPLLLRWHHFLLITCWNLSLTIFFLPGSPPVWLLFTALSLGISVLHRAINGRAHFLSAPELTRPMLFLFAVVIGTAEMTGGIGLHSMGAEVSGGRHYFTVIFGILGYFALTALKIPPPRVGFYISLYLLASASSVIGDLAGHLPSAFNFIFAFFPASVYDMDTKPGMIAFHARYAGVGVAGMAGVLCMLARYGVRGILLGGKPWRCLLFAISFILIFFGGFRSFVLICGLIFAILFFMEGLHQSKVMPAFLLAGVLGITLLVPFASHLPFTFQRALAFLPLKLDPAARLDAENSSDWRLEIWQDTYPEVPQHLLLGKGYAIDPAEMAILSNPNFHYLSVADQVAISGNYHSGPLSVLMPFGAWGAIGLLWLWIAGYRALYNNYRYGDPAFRVVNAFLLASFVVRIFMFLIVFGALENDVANFAVLLGLSVSINGGIRRPARASVPASVQPHPVPQSQPPFRPAFPR